jgi:hypothetical protein
MFSLAPGYERSAALLTFQASHISTKNGRIEADPLCGRTNSDSEILQFPDMKGVEPDRFE